jgi:outer membrane PBP1 activator LpoA protein
MKVARAVVPVLLSAAIAAVVGCSKQEPTPSAPVATKQAVAPAAPAASTAAAKSDAASLIDKARSLITDKKYSEASDLLKRLSSMKLTPEQKKLVDDLMAQAQKAIAGVSGATRSATDAAGGMLGGNK